MKRERVLMLFVFLLSITVVLNVLGVSAGRDLKPLEITENTFCSSDDSCGGSFPYCDTVVHKCRDNPMGEDEYGEACHINLLGAPDADAYCKNNDNFDRFYCDPVSTNCVQCYKDEHCNEDDTPLSEQRVCYSHSCRESCTSDSDCLAGEVCASYFCVTPEYIEDEIHTDFGSLSPGLIFLIIVIVAVVILLVVYSLILKKRKIDNKSKKKKNKR